MKNIRKTKLSYIINIPLIKDEAELIFGEINKHIPFEVKRFYVISKVDRGAIRGLHAHRNLQQVLFCIQGKVKFILDNGDVREEIVLDKSNEGIFIDKWMWREMAEFSEDAVLVIMASDYYSESDYIRDYKQFLNEVEIRKHRISIRYLTSLQFTLKDVILNSLNYINVIKSKYI